MSTFFRIFAQGLKIVPTLSHLSICIEQVIASHYSHSAAYNFHSLFPTNDTDIIFKLYKF